MPPNPYSLKERMPPGPGTVAMTKIRSTINSYTTKLSNSGWMTSIKFQTITSLQRRCGCHRDEFVGQANVGKEIALQQLTARIGAVVSIMKVVDKWSSTQNDDELVAIPELLVPIMSYFKVEKLELGPDLMILCQYAYFRINFSEAGSVSDAMAHINYDGLVKSHSQLMCAPGNGPDEHDDPAAGDHTGDASGPSACADGPLKASKHQRRLQKQIDNGVVLKSRVTLDPLVQSTSWSPMRSSRRCTLCRRMPTRLRSASPPSPRTSRWSTTNGCT